MSDDQHQLLRSIGGVLFFIVLIWFFIALIRAMLGVNKTQEKLDRVLEELQDLKQRVGPEQVKNDKDRDQEVDGDHNRPDAADG